MKMAPVKFKIKDGNLRLLEKKRLPRLKIDVGRSQYFVEAGAMAVRRCKKSDLKRIAKATGAQMLSSLANLEGEESFEASSIGEAQEVAQERICDDELIIIKGYPPPWTFSFMIVPSKYSHGLRCRVSQSQSNDDQ